MNLSEKGPKSILSFAIADKLYIFVTSSALVVYELGSSSATPIAINGSPLKQILVATQSAQPFPGMYMYYLLVHLYVFKTSNFCSKLFAN